MPPEDRVVPLSVVETLRSEHQHLTHQLHARIAELEATNNHLIEKNMALVEVVQSSAQRQQQLHYEGAAEEKEKEKDNMSVFSMDKSTYQNQITLMAQHSAELDQQVDYYSYFVVRTTVMCVLYALFAIQYVLYMYLCSSQMTVRLIPPTLFLDWMQNLLFSIYITVITHIILY